MKTGTVTLLLLLLSGTLFAQDEEDTQILDTLNTVDGRKRVEVRAENLYRLIYRNLRSLRDKEMTWGEVKSIEYDGMDSGYYAAGMKQMAAANFDAAAEHFSTLAGNDGGREWPGAYGMYLGGQCLEKAGRFDQAAARFAAFCAKYPLHRWWINAKYFEGINYARQGKAAEAKAVIEALKAYQEMKQNRPIILRGGDKRGQAIEATLLAVEGKMSDAEDLAARTKFGQGDEEISYHWDNFWAYFLLENKRFATAAAAFAKLQKQAAGDPLREAEISIGYGKSLMGDGDSVGDLDGALLQFLKLDILPYGTPVQRCEAQFYAGKIMLKVAKQNAAADAPAVQQELSESQMNQARLLLGACLANSCTSDVKAKAQDLITQYFPPPPAPEEPAAGAPKQP